jgi:multicomponent Na+:H+ antiporter subunit D
MLGIPPTIGFLGRWRLYETAVQIGWPLAAILILSSILALVAYVLALTRYWWGPPSEEAPPPLGNSSKAEPILLRAAIVLMVVLILAAGIWPNMLAMVTGVRP